MAQVQALLALASRAMRANLILSDADFECAEADTRSARREPGPFEVDIDAIPQTQAPAEADEDLCALLARIDSSKLDRHSAQNSTIYTTYDFVNKKRSGLHTNASMLTGAEASLLGSLSVSPEEGRSRGDADVSNGLPGCLLYTSPSPRDS